MEFLRIMYGLNQHLVIIVEVCTSSYEGVVETSMELLRRYGFVPEENKYDKFLLKRGGDGCIESLDGWTTTLEEDEKVLLEDSGLTENMRKVLQLRCQLKRSYV